MPKLRNLDVSKGIFLTTYLSLRMTGALFGGSGLLKKAYSTLLSSYSLIAQTITVLV